MIKGLRLSKLVASGAIGALLAGAVATPVIVNADINGTAVGNTSLTLTSDASAITLDAVPSFAWGSMTTTASTTDTTVAGAGNIQVTDTRGGTSGYRVTALASSMISGGNTLPVSAMALDSTVSNANLTGVTGADITSANNVLLGGANANGTLATTSSTGHITVGNTAKVGAYTGTITYTIVDGGL